MRTVQIHQMLTALMTEEDGVTSIEYALLAALIFSVIVISVGSAGTSLAAVFAAVTAGFP